MPNANEPIDTVINNTKFNASTISAAFCSIFGESNALRSHSQVVKNSIKRRENRLLRFSQKMRRVDPCFY